MERERRKTEWTDGRQEGGMEEASGVDTFG